VWTERARDGQKRGRADGEGWRHAVCVAAGRYRRGWALASSGGVGRSGDGQRGVAARIDLAVMD
jgi:hypothetical protein